MVPNQHERHLLIPERNKQNRNGNNTHSSSESDSAEFLINGRNCVEEGYSEEYRHTSHRYLEDYESSTCPFKMSRLRWRNRLVKRVLFCIVIVPFLLVTFYMPELMTNMQTRQAALLDWGYNTSRNIADYVLPENNTVVLEPKHVCDNKIFLLVVVCSSMQNFAMRQIIRETWGNTSNFNYGMFKKLHYRFEGQYLSPTVERLKYYSEYLNIPNDDDVTTAPAIIPVKVYFLLGRNRPDAYEYNETTALIRTESEQYGDIIQENFIDTYNNLTLKSVLALKWMNQRCSQRSAFFMKADDDTFLNMPNLLHYLLGGTIPLYNDTMDLYDTHTYRVLSPRNRFNSTRNYLGGHLFCSSRPVSVISNKWYMPYYMFPGDKYPKYLSGSAYVMSADVVSRLYAAALNTTFIHIEDVYLTGMCAEKIHLPRRHNALFSYTRAKDWCSFRGSITQHEVKDESMLDAYLFVSNTSLYCAPPAKYMNKHLRKQIGCV
ncbi:beta-1,3-galactosyltransferase 1 [Ceratitis capitata]|uniref:beta-1,3-galactosyltransferase 1 n=1 Tax=Ceratitis capitata TaxID=7213 RepID=UPI0003297F59|nr:beta-1,3-galactosyltransferase 1 [Ceratitis capitata]XP_012160108.1 beta-1,3-galactosyltransferase 1 [Ceratitis capitata]